MVSPGCDHCYVYRMDAKYGRDPSHIVKTRDFDLPIKKRRDGLFKIPAGDTVYTCFTSDFFLQEADDWRIDAWRMVRARDDLHFFIITKRIDRFAAQLPQDWGDGYPNVTISSTCENQDRADYRLPILLDLPIQHKSIICEPLLGPIHLAKYLCPSIENVIVGGESGADARVCDYAWVLDIRRQCMEAGVAFQFRQTGARFLKDGRLYHIKRNLQHAQAAKANIDFAG